MRMLPLLVVPVAMALSASTQNKSPEHPAQESGHDVTVQMRNVTYHYTDTIVVQIPRLDGKLLPRPGEFPVFDDRKSFIIDISSAEVGISLDALQHVMNEYVFAADDAPMKDITVDAEKGQLKIKGKLHSKGDISFEAAGTLTPTEDGNIRLHTEKIKALHLPAKGIMDLLGVKIADMLKQKQVTGVFADGNDLILVPRDILPAPHVEGKVTNVRVDDKQVVQVFGNDPPKSVFRGNYMFYRGGKLGFGKLIMNDADLELIDMDERDPFDFFLDHYVEQLTAGYTKTTKSFGLRVRMRDFNKLHQLPSKAN